MNRRLIDDCFLSDKDRLTHNEALQILKNNAEPLTTTELIPLESASYRVLATDITAKRPIPAHNNAAVDGFSFAYEDYEGKGDVALKVHGRVAAGDAELEVPPKATAARIFTGAVMPATHDTVVMQEDIELEALNGDEQVVHIPSGLKPGTNCRRAGEDTGIGDLLASSGTLLKPQHIAAIASGGYGEVEAYQPLSIAYFSTGDEIIRPGETFTLGKVFDANAPMISALAHQPSQTVTDLGILKDDPDLVKTALSDAAKKYNVLITSGGASKGEEDHIINALGELGRSHMWQLAIKPGRPMTFGQINDTIFIGLPGNPVAAFVCYLLYVSPLLHRLAGANWLEPRRFMIPADFEIKSKKPLRREFLRAELITENGHLKARKYKQDGSGLIRSLTLTDGLVELDEALTSVEKDSLVPFIPFSEFSV